MPDLRSGMKPGVLFTSLVLFNGIVVIGATAAGAQAGDPVKFFAEHHLVTWVSFFQLLAISWVAYGIFQNRRPDGSDFRWRDSHAIWAIVSLGFLYLACDEFFRLHESIDHRVHDVLEWFGVKRTGRSDRIDDLVVALYGIAAIGVLYSYRVEIRKASQAIPYLVSGFVFLFAMIVADTMTNGTDLLARRVPIERILAFHVGFEIAEESLKLLGESCFLTFFCGVFRLSKARAESPAFLGRDARTA